MGVANKAWKYSGGVVVNNLGTFCNNTNNNYDVKDKEKLKVQEQLQQQHWRWWWWWWAASNASTTTSARRPKISWSVKICGVMLFAVGLISLFTGHLASDLEWYSQRLVKRTLYYKLNGNGRTTVDIWKSKFSNFYYGCSERGRHFAPAIRVRASNGYLLIATSGGLNQQRTGITDAVVVARILNATLVVPELDHQSFWKDDSEFLNIFDVDWFISNLAKDVTIVKRVPERVMRSMEKPPYTMRVPRKSEPEYYLDQVLPILLRRRGKQLSLPNFMHQDDYLVLEDKSGRVKLRGIKLLPAVYVTGIVVGLHGKETGVGDFWVEDILEAGLPDQEQSIAAKIVQVVIAGNSVEIPRGLLNGQNLGSKDQSTLSEPIKELDILLTQITAGLPVDIMPGENDPANFSLPQQPLHRCLFPGSSAYNTFRSCHNPHSFKLDDVSFLGTSGQNIDDLEKYSDVKDKLEFMERTLRWRHLAPTAPNTLGCYPFTDKDPFFIETCPNVYFVGNQEKYATRLIKGSEGQIVRLICIPSFSETGVAVVLNLRNLECHTLSFGTQFS